jgi:hypothetical protein
MELFTINFWRIKIKISSLVSQQYIACSGSNWNGKNYLLAKKPLQTYKLCVPESISAGI